MRPCSRDICFHQYTRLAALYKTCTIYVYIVRLLAFGLAQAWRFWHVLRGSRVKSRPAHRLHWLRVFADSLCPTNIRYDILWRIDLLLGKDIEADKKTTRQQPFLCNSAVNSLCNNRVTVGNGVMQHLLGSCNSCTTTMKGGCCLCCPCQEVTLKKIGCNSGTT
jgi:hypothetical protein